MMCDLSAGRPRAHTKRGGGVRGGNAERTPGQGVAARQINLSRPQNISILVWFDN